MKRFAPIFGVFALFASLAWGSTAFILWGEEQHRLQKEEKERAYWRSPSFLFRPTKCRDKKGGEDCAILLTPGVGSALLFPQMGRVEVEGTVDLRPVKLVVQHGKRGQKHSSIPQGYKLVSCFCDQKECLIRTPSAPIWVYHDRTWGGIVFTKNKPE